MSLSIFLTLLSVVSNSLVTACHLTLTLTVFGVGTTQLQQCYWISAVMKLILVVTPWLATV